MVWVSPMTFIANTPLTAAQMNTFMRDNLNETEAARATTAGSLFWSTTDNSIRERPVRGGDMWAFGTTASTSYVDLTTFGPTVTVDTGQYALVMFSVAMQNAGSDEACYANYYITGATEASHDPLSELTVWGGSARQARTMSVSWCTNLTPGSNTFTLQYRVSAGTGQFDHRHMVVIAL